jgi:hypothetical protein
MPLPIATLYAEELKATMRGRFAWLGGECLACYQAAHSCAFFGYT